MKDFDYFRLIHKYIPPNSPTYPYFIIHSNLVTAKALKIAKRLNLSKKQKKFIEEASMLHDIGIIKTKFGDKHLKVFEQWERKFGNTTDSL